jgi:tryptophan 2,3-dioxygenase
MHELTAWLSATPADPRQFPYEPVVTAIQQVGKASLSDEVLVLLDKARGALPAAALAAEPDPQPLRSFLDVVLDRWDGRFDAPSYLALPLLPLPAGEDLGGAWRDHDWDVIALIADLLRFEATAVEHPGDVPLPRQRPPVAVVAKRCRLALRAATPALTRLRVTRPDPTEQPLHVGQRVWADVTRRLEPGRERAVRLSMLPVATYHDEWLFIRVLQTYEACFALMAVELRAAIAVLRRGNARLAAIYLDGAACALREAAPLFSLLATMQRDSFNRFRAYTEGASAIQSRHAKLVEALCRRPDDDRLDSAAFVSVPEVRQAVLDGEVVGFEDVYTDLVGRFDGGQRRRVDEAMARLAQVLGQWRQTHHRIAVRMLGDQPGTGYTAGPAYLDAVRSIPIFRTVAADHTDDHTFSGLGDRSCR